MKNMTRRDFLKASTVAVATVTFFAGCGSSSDSADSSDVTTSTTTDNDTDTSTAEEAVETTTTSGSATGLTEEDLFTYPETDESFFSTTPVDGGVAITGCSSTDEVIVIPETIAGETVVEIADSAFAMTEYIGICLPDTVVQIGTYAFMMASSLEVLWLGEGLEIVGESAFGSCVSLKTLTFPVGTTTFKAITFYSCTELEYVYFPDTVDTLPQSEGLVSLSSCPNIIFVVSAGSAVESAAIEQGIPYENY